MKYAPGIAEYIDRFNRVLPPDFYTRPVEEQRRLYDNLNDEFPYEIPDGVTIHDATLSCRGRRLPVRIYRPEKPAGRGGVCFMRGGGFVIGSLATSNVVVAELAARSRVTAFALDFRMAPEHPFPAAIEDCYDSLCAIVAAADLLDVDPRRIVVAGDSSGANMAVVVAMMCRDRGGPRPAGQALMNPVLDFTRWRHGGEDAPLLSGGEMEFFTGCYCPRAGDEARPYVSPLVSGTFDRLPPAYIMGAELDPLRVDCQRYAERLRANGIAVHLVIEPGLVHAPIRARGMSPGVADAWERYCAAVGHLAESPGQYAAALSLPRVRRQREG